MSIIPRFFDKVKFFIFIENAMLINKINAKKK